jgi:cation diffusion facilitator CzcD-associated flavoprotein CzcO
VDFGIFVEHRNDGKAPGMTKKPDAIIVGAGPAGLAWAATMRSAGLNVVVLEKADRVGAVWRRHYAANRGNCQGLCRKVAASWRGA